MVTMHALSKHNDTLLQQTPPDSRAGLSSTERTLTLRTTSQHLYTPIYTGRASGTSDTVFFSPFLQRNTIPETMNKLLVITVLVALLALNTEGYRVLRQAQEEEEGSLGKIASTIKSYYSSAVDTASDYIDSIKGLKVKENVSNLYNQAAEIVSTYSGIVQDQVYHRLYLQQ
uniref:Apolipoprotein C-II n=2 Tax=Acanthochromis polyacanthus TaxID=80966 RepID=A0A3Q1GEK9_9TELE